MAEVVYGCGCSANGGDGIPLYCPTHYRTGAPKREQPRRCYLDFAVPAETAIREAMLRVEAMPADERLTAAVILLGEAKDRVADFVDGVERDNTPTDES